MSEALADSKLESEFKTKADALFQSLERVLALYLPGADLQIEVPVGKGVMASIRFKGPVTQENIDAMRKFLGHYKQFFPKKSDPDAQPSNITAQSIMNEFKLALDEDFDKRRGKPVTP